MNFRYWVCSRCLSDEFLARYTREHGEQQMCDYCGRQTGWQHRAIAYEELVELIQNGLLFEYEDPVEHIPWDGEYIIEPHATAQVLWDVEPPITEDTLLMEDLASACTGGHQEPAFPEALVERDALGLGPYERLVWGWKGFEHATSDPNVNPVHLASAVGDFDEIPPAKMLDAVTQAIEAGGLLRIAPAGTRWWRARVNEPHKTWTTASDLGPPPADKARDNRMSASGSPAFYAASTPEGAYQEVETYAGTPLFGMSIGEFISQRPVVLLDLTQLPSLPSLFDPENRNLRAPIKFLYYFSEAISQPVTLGLTPTASYRATQLFASHLCRNLVLEGQPLQGIEWRSAQDEKVTSCVLFIGSESVGEPNEGGSPLITLQRTIQRT